MEEVIRSLIPAFIAFLAYHIYVLNGRIKTKESILKDHLQMAKSSLEQGGKEYKIVQERLKNTTAQLEQQNLENKVLQQELEARGALIQRVREVLHEHR